MRPRSGLWLHNTDNRRVRTFDRAPIRGVPGRAGGYEAAAPAEYGLSEIALFGSFVRNGQTEASDLDVLLEFEESVSLFDVVRLENELAERLGVDVDLVTKDSLKPRIKARVTDDLVRV